MYTDIKDKHIHGLALMRITHLPTEFGWNYLASRLRTTDPE